MREYLKVEVLTDENRIDKLLKKGWEIIATNNYVIEPPDSRTQYHMGMPAKVKIQQLKDIVKKYEEYGFKDQLIQKVADQNGDNIEEYTIGGGRPVYSETATFIQEYEDVVNDQNVSVTKKFKDEDYNF
ncbi:hypothetical protein [Sutcliffiella horikoshii]|uniref:hypothetical protein n=1 Tax=Sutcliffiella horikoshii TaxID=79883 RepID=UPI001F420F68|nr:hypothetical protein [Sutcliffiella horikoshii]MCG1020772.1 hypothetical protein [Sutcliffiella horikoshii]